MNNIASKLSQEQYEANFSELHPALSTSAALTEANRCLYCYDSPCTIACPTHIDIPAFIKKISTQNLRGSAKIILQSNWVPLSCAKACPVEVLCEGACVLNAKGEKPIEIGRLQRFAIDAYFASGTPQLFQREPETGKKIGVIGSGPSGLACAAELYLLGHDVTIYEANNVAGGLNTFGLAPYKVRYKDSMNEVAMIQKLGVKFVLNYKIGVDISAEQFLNNHDAVFLGIGLGQSPDLGIPGEDLKGVFDGLSFIKNVKEEKWSSVDVGKRVAVIGAGNTAIDAATESIRLGAEEVYIIYRRSPKEMPAYASEFDLAKKDGVVFHFLTAPEKIIGKKSVEAIECLRMELGEPDEKGRRRPVPIPKSEFKIKVDMVIKAIGQKTNIEFLKSIPALNIVNGKVEINAETYSTGNSKVFAGGDCINGGKEVVNAAHDGKQAAHGIHSFLSSQK